MGLENISSPDQWNALEAQGSYCGMRDSYLVPEKALGGMLSLEVVEYKQRYEDGTLRP